MSGTRRGLAGHGRWHVLALVLYAALTIVLTWPLARNLNSAIPGDGFDGWQNYWNLWWIKTALIERIQSPLVTDLLYYPTGVSLYFHTLNPFNGLVSLPVQLSGSVLLAYNFVVLISFTLSGYGAFLLALWLLRRATIGWRSRYAAAFVAGAIFTFAPFHFAHLLGHMQVFAYQWIPFTVLYLLKGMEGWAQAGKHPTRDGATVPAPRARARLSRYRDPALAGFFLALAGLCDWYFGLYLGLFTGVAVLWTWLAHMRALGWWGALWRAVAPSAAAGVVAVVILSPMLVPMVREAVQYDFMVRPESDLYILSATAVDFILPNRLHALVPNAGFNALGNQIAPVSERTIAVGWGALLLALVAMVRSRRRALPWLLAAGFFALLAMGPQMHWLRLDWAQVPASEAQGGNWSLYALLNEIVPFMRISRSVSRFALMVQLSVAMMAAFGLAALMQGARGRVRWGLPLLATVVVVAEGWGVPYPLSPPDTPDFYARLAGQRTESAPRVEDAPNFALGATDAPVQTGAVLNLPMNYDRPGYLLYQTVHGMPLTIAYISRDDPRTLTERVPVLQQLRRLGEDILVVDMATAGKTVLADLGVAIVTLDRYKMPGGLEREYTEAVAQAIFGDDAPLHVDDRLTAYVVGAPAVPAPYLTLGESNWGALQTDESGEVIGRALGEGEAEVNIRHAPVDAVVSLVYSSPVPVAVRIVTAQGETNLALPASEGVRTEEVHVKNGGMLSLFAPGAVVKQLSVANGE